MTRIATVSILAVDMSAILDGLLGSLEASSTVNSDMSGSFQLGFGGSGDYDYGGSGVDRNPKAPPACLLERQGGRYCS